MVKINIADIRQEYTKGGLRENELPGDPLSLFSRWLQEAIDAEVDEPTAVLEISDRIADYAILQLRQ